jgi:hypothetical protein
MKAEPPRPRLTGQAEADLKARREREAQALRDNLQRRKQQARARAKTTDDAAPPWSGKDETE